MTQFNYSVDLVFCIDTTGSMGNLLAEVKDSASGFHNALKEAMEKKGKTINSLRIKVISYKDLNYDGDNSITQSSFLELPKDEVSYRSFLSSLTADGGEDEPESGMEALGLSIKSSWIKTGDRRRHIIVLYTDASAHKLGKDAGTPVHNPSGGYPESFDQLTDWWESQSMSLSSKRLVMFAPDAYPWTEIATNWQNVIHYASKAGGGLTDIDRNSILDAIVNSV